MRKQCLRCKDIHRVLAEKGFPVSYTSVCRYVRERRAEKSGKPKEVFVKQWYEPGQKCEFDWGEVKLRIGGRPVTFIMAVFALCHSEGRWAYLFRHQDNLAFMESHRNFFHDVHGVPHTMVYDNMKVAVILKPGGKKPTESLARMEAFYGFAHRFCNARAGWEKGLVERMLNFPGDFGCFDLLQCSVDKQSTISVKGCHYSVPDRLAGQTVVVQLFTEDAAREQWGHLTFLRRLLEAEAAAKRERSKACMEG